MEYAVFGGGCFWCLEAVFEQLTGVDSVLPGYCGGTIDKPTYEQVCEGNTGHAEIVQISFDPATISFRDLLLVFFSTHDPTTVNRQGYDIGSQYRSVIFAQSQRQEIEAKETIQKLDREKIWKAPIVTEVCPSQLVYPAEEYHRQYFRKHPEQGYCNLVINPKVAKFRKENTARLKAEFR